VTHPGDKGPVSEGHRAAEAYRLGEWRIDPQLNRITGPQGTHQLEPKLMDLLGVLSSQPGRVFSRDDLLDRVWPDVVVGEEVLTRGISELRRLLGDDSRAPRYIETIRKGGYRVVAERHGITPEASPSPTAPRPLGRLAVLGAVILVSAIAVYSILRGGDPGTETSVTPWQPRPLTGYPGNEVTPALSPDGRLVAFAWTGPGDDNWDVYVLQIGDASPLRLTEHPAVDIHPVWSPDAARLAYIHDEGQGAEIRVVPVLGGPSQRLLHLPLGLGGGFSWSPDGASLVYATRPSEDRSTQLFRYDLSTEESRALTTEAPLGRDDQEPEYSPDGRTIAFVRHRASGFQDLCVVPAEGGEPRCVRPGLLHIMGLDWTRDGHDLLCSAFHQGIFSLWRIDLPAGDVSWSGVLGEWIYTPSVARAADRLVYHHYRHQQNIWCISLGDPDGPEPVPVIASTHWDDEPDISPDGRHLAFTSTRSGTLELWLSDSDGSRPRQLTDFGGCLVARPRWSPGGDRIAFHANPHGLQELYTVEVDGGRPRRWDVGLGNALLSDWSRDGGWLYFVADRDGHWNIWRTRCDTSSTPDIVQVTTGGAICGYECADGYFYYARADQAGLWRLPLDVVGRQVTRGGGDRPWLPGLPPVGSWRSWTADGDHLFFLVQGEVGRELWSHHPGSGRRRMQARLPDGSSPAFAVNRVDSTCYFSRIERELGDLMLVEGFR